MPQKKQEQTVHRSLRAEDTGDCGIILYCYTYNLAQTKQGQTVYRSLRAEYTGDWVTIYLTILYFAFLHTFTCICTFNLPRNKQGQTVQRSERAQGRVSVFIYRYQT